jgi:hypothetical protein
MKSLTKNISLLLLALLMLVQSIVSANPTSGFYLPESIEEVTLQYRCINNLIVLPVVINNTLSVNLILDTGTRNIVLFGKRFRDMFEFVPGKKIQFSGMGSGKLVLGKLTLDNKVEITSLIGEKIALVVVADKNIFAGNPMIDGIIGYDIFQRFEVEIDPIKKLVTFRSPLVGLIPQGFVRIPMRVESTKPVIDSKILLQSGSTLNTNLMIDTGSELAILLKTTDDTLFSNFSEPLGTGMSGNIDGIKTWSQTINLEGLDFYNQPTGIILSAWHNYGSIGMGILKEYAMIINYVGEYTCLKKT